GDELQQVQRDAVADTLEPAVALSVSRHVGADLLANRQGRRAPELTGLFVPHVDRLARRVTHRIVGPPGHLVFAAVDGPRIAGAALGDLETEGGIGDHVDPGGGRPLAGPEDRRVLSSVAGEAAEA